MSANDYGVIITLPGFSATSSPSPENCAIHSKYPNPKISSQASPAHFGVSTYTFPDNPGAGTTRDLVTVAHGLSFVPAALAFVQSGTNFSTLTLHISGNPVSNQRIAYFTDSTNFIIRYYADIADVNVTNKVYTFKYYIFSENGK